MNRRWLVVLAFALLFVSPVGRRLRRLLAGRGGLGDPYANALEDPATGRGKLMPASAPPAEAAPSGSLSVPVSGALGSGTLLIGLDDRRRAAVAAAGGRLQSREPGVIQFDTGALEYLYLDSEPSTPFAMPPSRTALQLVAGSRVRLSLEGSCLGAASVWAIEYSEQERLRHARAPLKENGGTLDLVISAATTRVRFAVRVAGQGSLRLSGLRIDPLPLPRALAVAKGTFVPFTQREHAAAADELPAGVPVEIPPPARSATGREPKLAPIDVVLTVDTEDAYFTEPRLMTGAGVGDDWGVRGILDILEARSLRASFFLNAFESERQPAGTVASVAAELASRGHELALHTHPAPDLEWYREPLFLKSRSEQVEILSRGRAMLEEWSGQQVVSFRAGGYAMNDETLEALAEVGLRIDSSVFFPSPNNRGGHLTVNAPRVLGDVLEVPVTYVIRANPAGSNVEHRKLDLDWLTPDELIESVSRLRETAAPCATFMMHSFSFLEKATLPPEHPHSPRALFRSDTVFNRYVEIYGPKPQARSAFEGFLDRLASDPQVRLTTLREAEERLRAAADAKRPDVVPVIARA